MMAQSLAESKREITNLEDLSTNSSQTSLNQFERINKKYVDKKRLLYSIKYVLIKKGC